ncbi:MAG: hypothetical protein O7B99_03685 [Planctomycetota bacterium]|nr:hypothetical protein [Planctomycetota bacterium]
MNQNEIREMVSKAYSEALKRSRQGGDACCAPPGTTSTSCAPPPTSATSPPSIGEAARTAGYGEELAYYRHGGILPYVLRRLARA